MGSFMRQRALVVVAFCLLLSVSSTMTLAAGHALPAKQQPNEPQFGQRQGEPPKPDPELERKMAKERMKDRYKDLKRDSEKLLELATELKQQVDKSGENVLSMDVVKKCEEIEKLAKSVRTKMKGE